MSDQPLFLMKNSSAGLDGSNPGREESGIPRPGRRYAVGDGKLRPPKGRKIRVAVVVSDQATILDFAGAWEVFAGATIAVEGYDEHSGFELYTVSDTSGLIRCDGGLDLVAAYSLSDAPAPDVVTMGAQRSRSPALLDWIRRVHEDADVVMSVCTGAFLLAETGLLDETVATTHHSFYDRFAKLFPRVRLERGLRFVEGSKLATAGGLTSGIDLALRVVDRYYGREVAEATARHMEYDQTGWIL